MSRYGYLEYLIESLGIRDNESTVSMPPTSKNFEVGGAYCFWGVRRFVTLVDAQHNSRNVHGTVLKFLIWIPHETIADRFFWGFILDSIMPLS